VFAAACATPRISVGSTYDDAVDFSKVHTFAWLEVPPEAVTVVKESVLLRTVEQALIDKGLQRVDNNPDLLLAVHRTIEGSLSTMRSGYEVRNGRINRYPLNSGSLVVDLVSASTKETVWRGTAEGAFRANQTSQEREAMLQKLCAEMFEGFPPKS
jgi:hypothetical protein